MKLKNHLIHIAAILLMVLTIRCLMSSDPKDPNVFKTILINSSPQYLFTENSLSLAVLHDFGSVCIVKADTETLTILAKKGIDYQVIAFESSHLYLLTNKKGYLDFTEDKLKKDSYTKLIYTHQERNEPPVYLVESAPEKISDYGYLSITPLSEFRYYDSYLQRNLNYNREILDHAVVNELMSAIDSGLIAEYIQQLQDYGTRYFLHPNRREIVEWLRDEFYSFGFTEVEIDSFYIEEYKWGNFQPSWQYNLSATLRGDTYPDNYIIVGGHYDSIIFERFGDPMEIAPGADDNASGTAALLAIAKTIAEKGYQPKKSIRFIPFAAEEIGLYGSKNIAEKYESSGLNIELMINNDMIANVQTTDDWLVKIFPYSLHPYFGDLSAEIFSDFTSVSPVISNVNNPASDSYSFHQHGFASIFFHEYEFSQYYHSPDDIIDYCDTEYAAEIVRASLLTALYVERIPAEVSDILITNKGSGSEVVVKWNHPVTSDVKDYIVSVGTLGADGNLDVIDRISSNDTIQEISGLIEDHEYFFAVSAVNHSGYESIALQQGFTPQSAPQTPTDFRVIAGKNDIVLSWLPNPEQDIAGYNIYRASEPVMPDNPYISLFPDTYYIDADVEKNSHYYYSLTAVDYDSNESSPTALVRTGLFSLDNGILLVNATPQGSGEVFFPAEPSIFDFYDKLLAPFSTDYLLLDNADSLTIADIGFYSTVILFNDSINKITRDFSETFNDYLKGGGNLIVSGFNPLSFFNSDRSFIKDRLRIHSDYHIVGSYFNYAVSQKDNYPSLNLDKDKFFAVNNERLINIYGFEPAADNDVIFRYGSDYADIHPSGSMSGSVVGIMTEQTITLSFPLFYLNLDELKVFLGELLQDHFSEKLIDRETEGIFRNVQLLANYPNPFNKSTAISYFIADPGNIEISIYNMKGRLVNKLYSGYSHSGKDIISWDGKDNQDQTLPSGIYISQIKRGNSSHQRKIILIK